MLYLKNGNELEVLIEGLVSFMDSLPSNSFIKLGIDTETTGLDCHSDRLRLVQVAYQLPGKARECLVCDCFAIADIGVLSKLFNHSRALNIFFNAKFDIKFLRKAGVQINERVADCMLMYRVLDNGNCDLRSNLVTVVNDVLHLNWQQEHKKKNQASEWDAPILSQEQLEYAAKDAIVLLDLYTVLKKVLKSENLWHVADLIEHRALWGTIDMEYYGIPVDLGILTEMERALVPEIEALDAEIKAMFPIEVANLNSYVQLLKGFEALGLNPGKIENGEFKASTAEACLKEIDHPVIEKLLHWKSKVKLLQFVVKLPRHVNPKTGRIHCSFNQMGTVTGRYSSSDPNMQQLPRDSEIRNFMRARPGWKIVVADYSQIELVIGAEITQDPVMVEAYRSGKDVHKLTASMILNKPIEDITKSERQIAKAVNFGLIYGMGAKKLVTYAKNSYGVTLSAETSQEYREKYFDLYKGFSEWHRRASAEIRTELETYTLSGRRRLFSSHPQAPNAIKFTSYVNTQDQGTGGDITKLALYLCHKSFYPDTVQVIATVHDEIILEAREDKAEWAKEILVRNMIRAGETFIKSVPVMVEAAIGDTWKEAK